MLGNMFPEKIQELQDSRFMFYLTGSRFFGGNSELSDWDFFTLWTKEVVVFLVDRGFSATRHYEDSITSSVMTFEQGPLKVDIQLVDSVDLKNKAQKLLKPYIKMVEKSQRKILWELAFAALKSN